MPDVYLTPASIGYLAQWLLSVLVTGFLVVRLRHHRGDRVQARLLAAFFGILTIFIALMFMDVVLLPTPRLYVVYLENTILAAALVLLLRFSYHMPAFYPQRRREADLVLVLSLGYLLFETAYAVYRYVLLAQGTVDYRPGQADYVLAALFAWVPVVLFRQAVRADERQQGWWSKLIQPGGAGTRVTRDFAVIYLLTIGLNAINLMRNTNIVPAAVYNAALSLGILVILWMFVTVYLSFLPEANTFIIKLVGICLTLLLVILALVAWVVAPTRVAAYQPALADHQTLHFTPNTAGGYDVAEVPFNFETDMGATQVLTIYGSERSQLVAYSFPFFGKNYNTLYVTASGIIVMGQELYHPNLQRDYGEFPAIVPLLVDLDPDSGGGVRVRQAEDRLIVTWDHMSALQKTGAVYTFQSVLYPDGSFDITCNGLPDPLEYDPDGTPYASAWFRGITPGSSGVPVVVHDLSLAASSTDQGLLQDLFKDFRIYLHQSLILLAWLVLLGSLFIIIGLPLLLRPGLIRPLKALLVGVQQMNKGNLDVHIPSRDGDDIGILTETFNTMVASLKSHVSGLEIRVSERTRDLEAANAHLRTEMIGRESAQSELIEQQRALTALEERERMARDLHDGLGQMLGYINVQAQATQSLIADGQPGAAQASLESVLQASRDAHINLRSFIIGLRKHSVPVGNLFVMLRAFLKEFNEKSGVHASMSVPLGVTLPAFPPAVEEQILHIIQEALANARKHANASHIEILFSFDPRQVEMIITDDGIGFDPERNASNAAEKDHATDQRFGLEMMQERVEMVGGRMEVHTAPGQGTRLMFFIPRLQGGEFGTSSSSIKTIHGMRILLVDDSPIFTEGLRNLLMARGLTVVGLAADGLEAQEKARLLRPDVIIMDVNMPRCNGLEATLKIKAELPDVKIVMLTVTEDDDALFAAIKNGASGYLLKNLDANEFCRLLAGLARGEPPLTPHLASRLLEEFAHPTPAKVDPGAEKTLTHRQWQILELAASGLTYKEIGTAQKISEVTVKYHMRTILERLHLKNRADAIEYAKRLRKQR